MAVVRPRCNARKRAALDSPDPRPAGRHRRHGVSIVEPEVDIAIVGYGPVGQALAALLGRAGHEVAVFERRHEIYRLPRAVHIDHEIMRLLQALGLADRVAGEMIPLREYRWFGADRDPLMTLTPQQPAISGWEPSYLFFQPELRAGARRSRVCA